ncbi:MAG: ABC transporter permease [Actinobacteria bacterium]|nr:ABC transporter permease [Actinomycetota bacterium]MCI0545506.1 ABC transporter permease [Actinomycetota bacterium]
MTALPEQQSTPAPPGVLRVSWRMWRTKIGVAIVSLLVLIAFFGRFIAPFGENEALGIPNDPDLEGSLFGLGKLGYDVWTRFLYGGRPILVQAFLSTVLALVLGTIIGLVAAYNRRRLDDALMRTMDVMLALPQIILVLVVIAMFGAQTWLVVLAVGISTVPRIARVVRGTAVSVVERDFVASAEALGEPKMRILGAELLPNVTAPLLVEANLRLTFAIAVIGGIAFLGFTSDPGAANWGLMINEHRGVLAGGQPWGTMLPVIAIALLTIGTGLIGDGLSRAAAGIDRGTVDA